MKYSIIQIYIVCFLLFFEITGCKDSITEPKKDETELESIYTGSLPIEPYYPLPSKQQLVWQESELSMFIHFGISTFTEKEWSDGTDSPAVFNPGKLNAEQWVKTAKEYGFKYVILTAKHHEGFCLWPSKYTDYSIKNSPYKKGKGDIIKEFADACRKYGVEFGFYLSPWDRHEKSYGTDEYNTYFQKQLIELLTNYGDVGEVWFDNANGEGPNGKVQEYNWELIYSTVRHYQPKALIAVAGPDIRWVGNEDGFAKETEWCIQPRSFAIQQGENVWYPSESDVSIRPSWFFHDTENSSIKSGDKLIDIYLKSVGRNSNLLLNVPPNQDGLFTDKDITALKDFRQNLNEIFGKNLFAGQIIESSNTRNNSEDFSVSNCLDDKKETFWVTDKNINSAELVITLDKIKNINIVRLEEAIEYGQRIKSFSIFAEISGNWQQVSEGTTIGRSRILVFNPVETQKIKVVIHDSNASPTLRFIGGYYSSKVN